MKNICVFCASSSGSKPVYAETAKQLGHYLAEHNYRLIFGGGRVGLMGITADAVLEKGGEVYGVIPDFLDKKEVAHKGLTKLIIVSSMHERKTQMFDLSDGIIALPGGFGTLEELTEVLTWAQLGLHQKPIGILNVDGYYDHLVRLFDHMVSEGLLKKENRDMLLVSDSITELLTEISRRCSKDSSNQVAVKS